MNSITKLIQQTGLMHNLDVSIITSLLLSSLFFLSSFDLQFGTLYSCIMCTLCKSLCVFVCVVHVLIPRVWPLACRAVWGTVKACGGSV